MTDRPSAWLAGAGVGLCLVAACGVVVTLGGWAAPWQLYAALGGLGLGLTVATDFGLTVGHWRRAATVAVRLDEARAWANELANQTAERLLAADDDEPAPDPEPSRRAAWKGGLIRLFTAGEALGSFSQPKLARVVPSSDKWQALTDWYCANPDGDPVLRRTTSGTNWGIHWTLEKALLALATDELPLPPGPPPTILAHVAEKRAPEKAEKGKGATGTVVEGVSREVGK